jgi:hypothetical protein
MVGCKEFDGVGFLHVTIEDLKGPDRKQIHAPFFPPENSTFPPSTNVNGPTATATLVPSKGVIV